MSLVKKPLIKNILTILMIGELSSITFTLCAAAVPTAVALAPTATTEQATGLSVLPEVVLTKIREFLMGTRWVRYQELVSVAIPPAVAPKLYATAQPLESFFTREINKKRNEHPTYGRLSINDPEGDLSPVTLSDDRVTHDIPLPVFFGPLHAYFVRDCIVVEGENYDIQRSHEFVTLFIDAKTHEPIQFSCINAQPYEGKEVKASARVSVDEQLYVDSFFAGTLGNSFAPVKGVPGVVHLCSDNGRFLAAPHGFIDTVKHNYIILDKDQHFPLCMPVYKMPCNDCMVLLQRDSSLTMFDIKQLQIVAVLPLIAESVIEGWADPAVVQRVAPPTLKKALNPLVVSSRDSDRVTTDHGLVVPRQLSGTLGLCMEGMLSSYTPGNSFLGSLQARINCPRGIYKTNIVLTPEWEKLVTVIQKRYPRLAQRYGSCIRYKSFAIALALLLETPEKLNAVLLQLLDLPLAESIKEDFICIFVAQLALYYNNNKRASYKNMWDVKQDMLTRFPCIQEFQPLLRNNKNNKTLLMVIQQKIDLPNRMVTRETVAADMKELIDTQCDAVLEEAIKVWIVREFTQLARDRKFSCANMGELAQHMAGLPFLDQLPGDIWQDWMYALQESTGLPWESELLPQLEHKAPEELQAGAELSCPGAPTVAHVSSTIVQVPAAAHEAALEQDVKGASSRYSITVDAVAARAAVKNSVPAVPAAAVIYQPTLLGRVACSMYNNRKPLGAATVVCLGIWAWHNPDRIARVLRRLS